MNTYLVPVTKEYQSIFTDIMVIYANTEKEAYFNAQIEKWTYTKNNKKIYRYTIRIISWQTST